MGPFAGSSGWTERSLEPRLGRWTRSTPPFWLSFDWVSTRSCSRASPRTPPSRRRSSWQSLHCEDSSTRFFAESPAHRRSRLKEMTMWRSPPGPAWCRGRWASFVASWPRAKWRWLPPRWPILPICPSARTVAGHSLNSWKRRFTRAGWRCARVHFTPMSFTCGARPALLPGYEEGWFAVQDEASAVVAAALEAMPGERVYEPCGGPGGKAAHLGCLVGPSGLVVSAESRFGRAQLVARTARRLGAPVEVVAQDARRPALRGLFDAALVDAPCSGLGAARRRPELLWRPRKQDLAQLARLQVAILEATAELVRPGGRLVYSVCTFPRAETDAAARAFLSKRPDFEPM